MNENSIIILPNIQSSNISILLNIIIVKGVLKIRVLIGFICCNWLISSWVSRFFFPSLTLVPVVHVHALLL